MLEKKNNLQNSKYDIEKYTQKLKIETHVLSADSTNHKGGWCMLRNRQNRGMETNRMRWRCIHQRYQCTVMSEENGATAIN